MIENRIGLIEMDYLEYPNFPSMPEDIKQEILRIVEETETESLDDLLINSTPEVIEWVKEAGNEAQESELGFTGQEVRKNVSWSCKLSFLRCIRQDYRMGQYVCRRASHSYSGNGKRNYRCATY